MAGKTENGPWDEGFFAAVLPTLKDARLWLIVLPSLAICGLVLVLIKPPWLAGALCFGLALVVAPLINKIEILPRPDERKLAEGVYRNVLLPAATGLLIIPSVDLFSQLWVMQWHWFHPNGSIPACSFVWTISVLGWIGVFVAPAVTALLTGDRAVFATIVGLMAYVPMSLTTALAGDNLLSTTSLLVKSCHMDADDFASGAFGAGFVSGVLLRALLAIFIARVVMTWSSHKPATALPSEFPESRAANTADRSR